MAVSALVATATLLGCGAASALAADRRIDDFKTTTWGAREGAPTAGTALAQSADGFLWIGSPSGLVRFDGLGFEPVDLPRDQGLSSASVFSLFAPASGGVWIGFQFGAVAFIKDGTTKVYTERDGLPPGSVTALAADRDGTVWVGTSTGLARLDGAAWKRVGPDQGYSETQTISLFVDSAGTLWSLSRNKTFYLPHRATTFHELDKKRGDGNVLGLAESAAGEVWVTDGTALVKLAQNDNPKHAASSMGLALLFDKDGSLWGSGPWELGDSLFRIGRPAGLTDMSWAEAKRSVSTYSGHRGPTQSGPAMLEDREGNVWFTSPRGVTRLSERNVGVVALPAPVASAMSLGMAAGDLGSLWLIDRLGKTYHLTEGSTVSDDDGGPMSCIVAGNDGSVWFANKTGLWKRGSGHTERFPFPFDTEGFEVQAMAQDRGGAVWVAIARKGVFRLSDGEWLANGGVASLPRWPVVTLASDAAGRIWFGYTEGRVARLDGADVRLVSAPKPMGIGNVTALYAKRSQVWVGGEFGLAVYDGKELRAVDPEAGMSLNSVTGLVETDDGDLWINARGGIVHLPAAETRRLVAEPGHRPHGERMDSFDGVEGSSARLRPLPSAIEVADGSLRFLTDIGLYSIDPKRIHRNPLPPTVVITSLAAGNRMLAPGGEIRLDPGTVALRFDYVGLSLTQPEKVRYRYRLEGVDADWQDGQGRRQALYSGLRPGRHRFQVIAANDDGVWNETGAALDFVIAPTFFQTGWFIALCAAGIVLLAWLAAWLRVRQVAARLRVRFAERMAERERIARELHDTLLQSTQGLVLRFQAVANRIAPDDPSRALLDAALDRADAVMAEGRDRVLDLRVPADPSGDLPAAFTATGEELAHGRATSFRAIVEGTPRRLRPAAKDEIYRIGREALLNAFRHSQATAIEIQIIYGDDAFSLRVRDDGIGIETTVLEAGSRPDHWGLQGMRERAARIGARLDVWSRTGAGTEFELRVAAAAVYESTVRRRRWYSFHSFLGRSG